MIDPSQNDSFYVFGFIMKIRFPRGLRLKKKDIQGMGLFSSNER